MVKLSDEEKRMLQGEVGMLQQKALENIVKYGEALGAQKLCRVTKATLGLGAQPYLDHIKSNDYNRIFSRAYLCSDQTYDISESKFSESCFCLTCTENCDAHDYEELGVSKSFFDRNRTFLEITKKAGVSIASTCAPYLIGWLPLKGEHFVTTESSNAMFCNSILGACGNPDGVEAAVWSALSGRTPEWGLHLPSKRFATHQFNLEYKPASAKDWDVIGYTIGRLLPANSIPVISGNFACPNLIEAKQLFASIATTSGAVMCHIIGVTPEARTLSMATGGKPIEGHFVVDQKEYDESMSRLTADISGPVDLVSLGCPHYSLEEIQSVADYLVGKKIKANVRLYIWTAYPIKEMARVNGYLAQIEESGGRILTSSCPIMVGKSSVRNADGIALDGAKQAHYIRSMTNARIYYGDTRRCLDSALSGEWVK